MKKLKSTKFPYEWNLKDAIFKKDKGTVFNRYECTACNGSKNSRTNL